MSFGLSIQHARLLSDILEDCTSKSRSEKDVIRNGSLGDPNFNLGAQVEIPFFNVPTKPSEKDEFSGLTIPSVSLSLSSSSTADDPDTESDENGSPSSLTSVSCSDDDENASDCPDRRRLTTEDDILSKGLFDERACAKLLHNKMNVILDRIELDSSEAASILEGCSYLPSDLKFELAKRFIARKTVTDAALRCFLSIRSSSESSNTKERGTEMAQQLRQLSLCECQNVTDAGLQTIARCCPHLQALDLTGCQSITAVGIQGVIRCCCQLSELCLSGCPAFCDKTIPIIFRYNVPSHIRALSLRRCDIHDYGLSVLASYCPTLQKLDVRSCGLLTATGFRALIQRIPTMRMLSCGHCVGVDDMGLHSLALGYGESLTDLNLDSCWRVSSRGVGELTKYCKQLRSLNLSSCSSVDDTALKAICRSPYLQKSLQLINLNECNVGDDALEELIVNCSSLAFISVVGCPRVTYQRAVRIAQLAGVQIVM